MNNHPESKYIQAVVVNHNTSKYTELLLRSMFARHPGSLDLSITVLDNNSQAGMAELNAYAAHANVPVLPSGFELKTENNSHGQVLKNFVLEHPDCEYYLFLDTDVCFIEPDTINTMVRELEQDSTAFAIHPRLTSNGDHEIQEQYWDRVYHSRLHPCCALVKNTPLFRRVVEEIGFSCAKYLWADREEYLDTFQLMTMVLKSFGSPYIRSSKMVLHFFSVSYVWETAEVMEWKAGLRDKLLQELQNQDHT